MAHVSTWARAPAPAPYRRRCAQPHIFTKSCATWAAHHTHAHARMGMGQARTRMGHAHPRTTYGTHTPHAWAAPTHHAHGPQHGPRHGPCTTRTTRHTHGPQHGPHTTHGPHIWASGTERTGPPCTGTAGTAHNQQNRGHTRSSCQEGPSGRPCDKAAPLRKGRCGPPGAFWARPQGCFPPFSKFVLFFGVL
jgi:hypothetical protein